MIGLASAQIETKQDAINFSEEQRTRIENFGTAGITGLSPSELERAALAFAAIKRYSVSLNKVVKDWVAAARPAPRYRRDLCCWL